MSLIKRNLEASGEYARLYSQILTDGSEVYDVGVKIHEEEVMIPARNFECAQSIFNAIETYSS